MSVPYSSPHWQEDPYGDLAHQDLCDAAEDDQDFIDNDPED